MTKTSRIASRRRGKTIKAKLLTILSRINTLQKMGDNSANEFRTASIENLMTCLDEAEKAIKDAAEYYCDYL